MALQIAALLFVLFSAVTDGKRVTQNEEIMSLRLDKQAFGEEAANSTRKLFLWEKLLSPTGDENGNTKVEFFGDADAQGTLGWKVSKHGFKEQPGTAELYLASNNSEGKKHEVDFQKRFDKGDLVLLQSKLESDWQTREGCSISNPPPRCFENLPFMNEAALTKLLEGEKMQLKIDGDPGHFECHMMEQAYPALENKTAGSVVCPASDSGVRKLVIPMNVAWKEEDLRPGRLQLPDAELKHHTRGMLYLKYKCGSYTCSEASTIETMCQSFRIKKVAMYLAKKVPLENSAALHLSARPILWVVALFALLSPLRLFH